MANDFAIIMWVRHRFGDEKPDAEEQDVDWEAPFAGPVGEFRFTCPNVDSSQGAVLEFQHRGSRQFLTFPAPTPTLVGITPEHPVALNGQQWFGGVPGTPYQGQQPHWSTRLLLINPGVLRVENTLRIESTNFGGQWWAGQNLDNFTIDNVVVFFKTLPVLDPRNPSTDPTVVFR